MGTTRLFAVAACAAAVVGAGGNAAFAGEITGNGEFTQTPHEVWLGPDVGVVNPPPGTPGTACRPGAAE